jgi:hypothetical protein
MARLCLALYLVLAVLCVISEDRVFSTPEGRTQITANVIQVSHQSKDSEMPYSPVAFLRMSLEKYKQEVKGYTSILSKQERVLGNLEKPEKVGVSFRDQPFSVYMNWLEGGNGGLAAPQKVLYVQGENNDKLLVRPQGLAGYSGVWTKDTHADDVKKTGRFTIDEFGIYKGTERTLESMLAADEKGKLHVQYKGLVKVPQLEDRECYMFVRTPYDDKEDEGIQEYTYYIDKENWLQVGSILKDANDKLIAYYFFSHLQINPEFKKDQFTRAGL